VLDACCKNYFLELTSESEYQKVLKQKRTNNHAVQGKVSTASKISRILELLNDGQWHMLDDVQKKTKLDKDQLQQIVAFLKEYEFIATKDEKEEVRLQETARRFLAQNITS
jgi:hypothetical protein